MKKLRLFFLNRLALNSYISLNYSKALIYYNKILRLSPKEPGILYNIGLCYFGQKKFSHAETSLLKDLHIEGESPERLRTLGDLYYRWKQPHQARSYYERLAGCLKQEERWLNIRLNLLSSSQKAQLALSAADKLDEALKKMKNKNISRARELLEEGAEDDPSSYQILNNLGVIAMQEEQNSRKAASYFEEANRLMPLPVHQANLRKALA